MIKSRIKISLLLGALSLLLTGCTALKLVKLIQGGTIEEGAIYAEVPFEYRLGLIIVPVKIQGKQYDFVLDCGAPNVVSKQLAESLGLDATVTQTTFDSQGNEEDLDFVQLDEITVGGVVFKDMGAAVADLQAEVEVGCLRIDGFIGSNLMKHAVWEIDYEKQVITFAHAIDSFAVDLEHVEVPFSTNLVGTPFIDVSIEGQTEEKVTVDLGSNGGIMLSMETYHKVKSAGFNLPASIRYGTTASGIYGRGAPDTVLYLGMHTIQLETESVSTTLVSFARNRETTIGNRFLKNYRVILDWKASKLMLTPINPKPEIVEPQFGFSSTYDNGKLFIGALYVGASPEKNGLELGDEVLDVNGTSYEQITEDEWCTLLESGWEQDSISLILRKHTELEKHTFYRDSLPRF